MTTVLLVPCTVIHDFAGYTQAPSEDGRMGGVDGGSDGSDGGSGGPPDGSDGPSGGSDGGSGGALNGQTGGDTETGGTMVVVDCPDNPCQQIGAICIDGGLVQCVDRDGCLVGEADACPESQLCTGEAPEAGCTCPIDELCDAENEREGAYCQGETELVTCVEQSGCHIRQVTQCRKQAEERCVGENPFGVCELVAGRAELDDDDVFLSPDLTFYYPISILRSVTLRRLGFVTSEPSAGIRMAIYTDNSGPGERVATAVSLYQIDTGRNEYPITFPLPSSPAVLEGGDYWIAVAVEAGAYLVVSDAPPSDTRVQYYFQPRFWADAFPETVTGHMPGNANKARNVYIIGTPDPL